MQGFFGKTYRYKDKIIGVCNTLNPSMYMVGHQTTGGHKRLKWLPISDSADEVQAALDAWAKSKGLAEVLLAQTDGEGEYYDR